MDSKNLTTKVDKKGKSTIIVDDNKIEDMIKKGEKQNENELHKNIKLEENYLIDLDMKNDK